MCKRIADALARTPKERINFWDVMHEGLFLPNTPCLINAGKDSPQMMACFVLPVGDSIEEIFDSIKHTALVHKTGGGTGFSFSRLRPEGSIVKQTGGVASGPVSFMKVFDAATQQMKQGGVRRGANMGTLSIDHPDIVKFIKCKDIDGQISNFNISVAVTDEFMEELNSNINHDVPWICKFKEKLYLIRHDNDTPVEVKFPSDRKPDEYYSAFDIWDLICDQAWKNGEPGILFIDRIRASNGSEIEAVNPCGEQPLEAYEACCLGSIDLSKFVVDSSIDFIRLEDTVRTAVDILNRMVDLSEFPLQEIKDKVQQNRKIGLGVMGWADALIKMGIKYGDNDSYDKALEIMRLINETAHEHSEKQDYNNKTCTTIAPTGSISILADCSSGIEPNIEWETEHKREDFPDIKVVHKDAARELKEQHGTLPDYYVTSTEISYADHVAMQAHFQKYTDNAVSKTIIFSKTTTKEEVDQALKLAWKTGCKGLTVYRYGSRKGQVISKVQEAPEGLLELERPYCIDAKVFKVPMEMGDKVENAYIIIGLVDDKPYEVFVHGNIREVDKVTANYIDTTTRLVSLAMKGGVPLKYTISQLSKVPGTMLYSLPVKIANILKNFLEPEEMPQCPKCKSKLVFLEGCTKCSGCDWSECG